MDGDSYPWTRQENETTPAYAAFREYLGQSGERSIRRCADAIGKDASIVSRWSSKWNWVERVRAYDVYMVEAETDGIIDAVTDARNKNLALVDLLRDHLRTRLLHFIEKQEDPTMRWVAAAKVMSDIERNSFAMVDDKRSQEQMEEVRELLARIDRADSDADH